ncbi:hypothetical protein [Salinisphaera hydrothermalis]|uniref:Uncharacterized protein n=1 Tax=Salinisphaera hydrothermalis (strain C41B8) TaxID=1304275 RepID=A0A084IIG0_SALHC|nr:hypothetical protein [Salinisphaera hydrothermalis]KEZ76494.1 hypothetical protein C41B8_14660 [Salinisphaera hydrothermalis C41B8]
MNLDRLKKTAPWALALMIATATPAAFAEQQHHESVSIGSTTLQLGTNQTAALGEARSVFNVSPGSRNGEYFLYPKAVPLGKNGESKQPDAVGSITFANGRLVRVTRNLGSFRSADGQAAIQNMIQAFSDAPSQGQRPAVHTDSSMSGDASTTRVYFSYPDRVIQVLVFQPADTSELATVDITEQYALSGNPAPNNQTMSQ